MIFATVGAQMPFDRLIHALDAWAAAHPHVGIFAQVGHTPRPPRHMPFERSMTPEAFIAKVRAASLIVAHAGMGSIFTALEYARPILVMPRRADLRETRNDHQLATVRRFGAAGKIMVAADEHELVVRLDQLVAPSGSSRPLAPEIGPHASPELIQALRCFILGGEVATFGSRAPRPSSTAAGDPP